MTQTLKMAHVSVDFKVFRGALSIGNGFRCNNPSHTLIFNSQNYFLTIIKIIRPSQVTFVPANLELAWTVCT